MNVPSFLRTILATTPGGTACGSALFAGAAPAASARLEHFGDVLGQALDHRAAAAAAEASPTTTEARWSSVPVSSGATRGERGRLLPRLRSPDERPGAVAQVSGAHEPTTSPFHGVHALEAPAHRTIVASDAPSGTPPSSAGPCGSVDGPGDAGPATRRGALVGARHAARSVESSDSGSVPPSDRIQDAATILSAAAQVQSQVPRSVDETAPKGAAHAAPITAALRASNAASAPTSVTSRKGESKVPATRRDSLRAPESAPAPEAQAQAKVTSLPSVISNEAHHSPGTIAAPTAPAQPLPLPSTPVGVDVAGGVLRSAAHLKVDAGVLGAVDLHLRVRDGAVHLRVEGDAAPLVEARSAELGRALAGEGLTLGTIELPRPEGAPLQDGTNADHGEGRRQGWEEAADAREAVRQGGGSPRAATKARSTHDGSIDVQA